MGLENNSSFESYPTQINKKSDAETIIDMEKIDKSKNIAKINDILVILEGKIDPLTFYIKSNKNVRGEKFQIHSPSFS